MLSLNKKIEFLLIINIVTLKRMSSALVELAPCVVGEQAPLKIQTMVMKKSKKTCAICIEGFQEEQIIKKLYCSHIFHRKCLK